MLKSFLYFYTMVGNKLQLFFRLRLLCKLLLFLNYLIPPLVNGQEVVLSVKFKDEIPKEWNISSTNPKKTWQAKSYKDNYYLQMNAWAGKGNPGYKVKAILTSPLISKIDSTQCKLKFSFADAFANGQPLQISITDEKGKKLEMLDSQYWKPLLNNTDFYDNVYEETEWIPLPQIAQPYKLNFIYDSDEGRITTTIQLSQIDVWCQ